MRFLIYALMIDFFFGLNGRQIMIGDEPIRSILYYAAIALVCVKGFYHLFLRLREHMKQGNSFFKAFWKEVRVFTMVDILCGILIFSHVIWIFIIPYTQLDESPYAMFYAYERAHPILYTLIYFPAVYLIRIGKVQWEKYRKFAIFGCVAIGIIHLVLFVGENIQRTIDPSVYLLKKIQLIWHDFIGGHSDPSEVFMPIYSVRVIQNFNLFIPMSFYFIVGKKGKRYWFWSMLNILALFTISARSHIVAVVAGICVFCFLEWTISHYTKEQWKALWKKVAVVAVFAVLADVSIFGGRNITRMASSFLVSESVLESGEAERLTYDSREYSTEYEIRGARNSNSTRILEIRHAIDKFLEKPILGHGYFLQSIDMQALMYVARTGLVGLSLWVICMTYLFRNVYLLEKKKKAGVLPVCFFFTMVLVDSVFQYFFSPVAIVGIVFVMLDLAYRTTQAEGLVEQKAESLVEYEAENA